ncbi:MAG: ribonuclease HI [Proteobacteria bacterium]|jgi:ribonuclease HI|nr:ribonuclease HI [Pseudomonadota bacterium]
MSKIIIYTDGACSMPSMKGGWGAVLKYGDTVKEIAGFSKETTNNQMELTACIEALSSITRDIEIEIHTDSQYVKKGITEWIFNWKKNGWKTAAKQPVKNAELWIKLDVLNAKLKPQWHWVKAHNGNVLNERADFLATNQIQKNR